MKSNNNTERFYLGTIKDQLDLFKSSNDPENLTPQTIRLVCVLEKLVIEGLTTEEVYDYLYVN